MNEGNEIGHSQPTESTSGMGVGNIPRDLPQSINRGSEINGELRERRVMVEEDAPRPMAVGEVAGSPRGRAINIEPLNYGFIVRVGCQSFAVEQADTVADKLKEYLNDPQATEKKWYAGELFKK